jgi:HIP---CoA ligase
MAQWAFAHHGEEEAVVEPATPGQPRRSVSWLELGASCRQVAAALVSSGLEPGERVGLWAPNGLAWILAMVGTQLAGGVVVPLSTRYRGREAAYILGRSRASFLFAVGEFLGTDYPELLEGHPLPDLRRRILLDVAHSRGDSGQGGSWCGWRAFMAGTAAGTEREVERRIEAVSATDMSDLMFTSGTTGNPKGVIAAHGQSLRVFREWADIVGLRFGDRYLIVNPMSHTFGYKAGVLACLMTGATMVPLPSFDVAAVIQVIDQERVSIVPGPPTLYQSLLDHPERSTSDLSSLRQAVTGAAVIPTVLVRRILDDLGFESVVTAYGLTESCGCITACRRGDPVETIALTSGRAFSGVEVRVVGDDGAEAASGDAGEILCRGYNVMVGYYEDPAATAEAIDADGWLHTGDIGTMDVDGNVRITDRKKDMFIVGGFNVYPAEVENLLLHHPDLSQVAVVGVPDERMGEVGIAYAVPGAGRHVQAADIIAWARTEMANYKVPRRVEIVEALPLNASGKVIKYELRQRAAAAAGQEKRP